MEESHKVKNLNFERIEGSKYHLKLVCKRCSFGFRYNTLKHYPGTCPSCNSKIEPIDPEF